MDNHLKDILQELIKIPSISPDDKGCQAYMIEKLEAMGFKCSLYNKPPVSNFYASIGEGKPIVMFAGHTDVVPAGDIEDWHSNPFELTEKNGQLYGRGVADMKGSLAAMLVMAEQFLKNHPKFKGQLAFLITSGEEGDDYEHGTPYVMEQLKQQSIHPDYCIVGEPSSTLETGDSVKVGRRGSISAKLLVHGIQGHVAYPHLADNPIHRLSPAMAELSSTEWDKGNAFFPPTTMQITHIHAGHAGNIIPGSLEMAFNFRYSPELTHEEIKQKVNACLKRHDIKYTIEWRLSGEPFLTAKGVLLDAVEQSIDTVCKKMPELSTAGGTSDGRFIAKYDVEVVEVGPPNASIHQTNETLRPEDLERLSEIYYHICKFLLL